MTIVLTILSAVIPSLLLLRYFYKRDLNPEPRGVLIKTFILGILIIVPVVIIAGPLCLLAFKIDHPMLAGFYMALLCAAIPEEFFKYLVVTRYSARNPAFDEPMDGIVYGATASLGFATLENILYVVRGGWTVAVVRALTAVPCHACLGAILGYYVGQGRFSADQKGSARLGLFIAIVLHGLYDFPLLVMVRLGGRPHGNSALSLVLLICSLAVLAVEIVWTRRIVKRLRQKQIQACTE